MMRLLSLPFSAFYGCLLGLVTLIGILANIFVILAVIGDKKMRFSGMNLLLLNLAVADLLYLIVFVHAWIPILLYGNGGFILPFKWCPAVRYLSNVFIIASIFTYTAICVERYIAIVHPMKASNLCSRQNIFLIICVIWMFDTIFQLPYVIFYVGQPIENESLFFLSNFRPKSLATVSLCLNPYGNHVYWAIFKWSEVLLTYVIPCILSAVLYTKICKVLWSKNSQLRKDTKEDSITEAVAARRSVVKMLIACVAIFYICYTPMISFYAYGFFWKKRLPLSWEAVLLITAMVMAVSAFNPFLYTLFSKAFRVRVKEIITCSKSSSWNKKELKRSDRETTKSILLL